MLNEEFAPPYRDGSDTVPGTRQLTGHCANGVRIMAKVYCGNQGILETESRPDRPQGSLEGMHNVTR